MANDILLQKIDDEIELFENLPDEVRVRLEASARFCADEIDVIVSLIESESAAGLDRMRDFRRQVATPAHERVQ